MGRWTPEEDVKLTNYVARHTADGAIDWAGASIGGRTSKQCRERWSGIIDPALAKGP